MRAAGALVALGSGVEGTLSVLNSTNDCRIPGSTVAPYKQCGGSGWNGPTECCCVDQQCLGDDNYKQCKPAALHDGPIMTHYWDCCKPSCSWTGSSTVIKSCDATGMKTVSDTNEKSVCDDPAGSATCKDQMPWIDGGILFGFGAVAGDPKTDNICGKCLEVTFSNARGNVTKAQIMVTNGGDSNPGNIDLLVPGGGFGEFTGCHSYGGWDVYKPTGPCDPGSNTPQCALYGGFGQEAYCTSAFPSDAAAQQSCHKVLWGVFPQVGCNHDAGYVPNLNIASQKEIPCPAALLSKV